VFSVEVGEALGLFEALPWLRVMSFDNVDFEIDSKITRDAFHSRREDISEFGHIITSCKSLFTAFFINSRVEFSRRQANAAAHALAGEASFLASPTTYFRIPSYIESIIINEMHGACFPKKKKTLANFIHRYPTYMVFWPSLLFYAESPNQF